MTTIQPTEKGTVPETAARIGTDAEGRTHYHAGGATDHRVFVDASDGVLVFDLGVTPYDVEDWVDHVDAWDTLVYDQDLVAMLTDGAERDV